jgi:hypothetical protein
MPAETTSVISFTKSLTEPLSSALSAAAIPGSTAVPAGFKPKIISSEIINWRIYQQDFRPHNLTYEPLADCQFVNG